MLQNNGEKRYVCKICQDIIDSNISTIEELQKNISAKEIKNDFLKYLLKEIIDSLEHIPAKSSQEAEESFESLNIYLIFKLLNCDNDINSLKKAYKEILSIKQLSREIINQKLNELSR